jgi:hypothetical protein
MEGTARIWFTPQQRAELWERWKNGQCVADIARALERRNKSGVYRILTLNGGIAPEPRRRAAGRQAKGGNTKSGLGQIVDTVSAIICFRSRAKRGIYLVR